MEVLQWKKELSGERQVNAKNAKSKDDVIGYELGWNVIDVCERRRARTKLTLGRLRVGGRMS